MTEKTQLLHFTERGEKQQEEKCQQESPIAHGKEEYAPTDFEKPLGHVGRYLTTRREVNAIHQEVHHEQQIVYRHVPTVSSWNWRMIQHLITGNGIAPHHPVCFL